jgi:NADPH2:quinone reductase
VRAIQVTEFGGPEQLQLVELPDPEPQDGLVLIDVARAGINFADAGQRSNLYLAVQHLPLVPGLEVVGRRQDTGERVVGLCPSGGYAERTLVPEVTTFRVPDEVDDETAIAILLQGLTAYNVLRISAQVQEGESVLVQAAAGGVGSLAVQLAKVFGAGRVIAMASSDEKRALAQELGADAVIAAEPEDLHARILEANSGAGVDVVLEMTGGKVFEECLAALDAHGRLVVYGAAGLQPTQVDTRRLMQGSTQVSGFWLANCIGREEMLDDALEELFALVGSGQVRPVIGRTYGLSEAAQAHRELEGRRTKGKLLLDPAG